jgi:DNA-binding transcriptional regulator LsrR (DeoR family)
MAEVKINKTSEKVIIWLYRENKTQQWLADQLGQTRQSVSQKIRDNYFSAGDLIKMKYLGFNIE